MSAASVVDPARIRALVIEGCDFDAFPPGGQLSFTKHLLRSFGDRLGLVGFATDGAEVGVWRMREIGGVRFAFLGVARVAPVPRRPLIPHRLRFALGLRRRRRAIESLGVRSVFLEAPEALFACGGWDWASRCYILHGVANPLRNSRYPGARLFAGWAGRRMMTALARVDTILACADDEAIAGLVADSGGLLTRDRVHRFPTRVDTAVFRPTDRAAARQALGLAPDAVVLTNSGRVNRVKGWDLLLDAFALFRRSTPGARLVFVGDGEDRAALQARARALGAADAVSVTGFQPPEVVALHLNAADVVLVGSVGEGWSVAMLEALACGKPVVTTRVSGAADMIREGRNGYIVNERAPAAFADAIARALALPDAQATSLAQGAPYSLDRLAADIGRLWPPLDLSAGPPDAAR